MPMKQTEKNNPLKDKSVGRSNKLSDFIKKKVATEETLFIAGTLLLTLALILINLQLGKSSFKNTISSYKVGTVAERDVVVNRNIVFIDKKATKLKRDAKAKLVPPVFEVKEGIVNKVHDSFMKFKDVVLQGYHSGSNIGNTFLRVQLVVPGFGDEKLIKDLLSNSDPLAILSETEKILMQLENTGIVAPTYSMDFKELLNAGEVEIWRWVKGSLKKDKVPINQLISLKNINDAVRKILNTEEVSTFGFNDRTLISRIVSEFAEEDCFLNREETLSKRQKVYNEVEPVLGKLVKGQVIIRKGDIVTEPIKSKIDALGEYSFQINVKGITGTVLFLALLFILTLYLLSENIIGIKLNREQIRLLAGLTVSYTTIAVVLFRVSGVSGWIPFSVIIPTATFAILVTILVSEHAGIIVSLFMALLLVLIAKMDIYTFLFAFFSGVGASTLAQKTEKRINLITSGLYMAGFNAGFLIILGFFKNYNFSQFMAAIGWGFGNGFLCSIFALGFLPILEQIMNAPTVFRLMELSDLNAPAMKKMLALAPGTYNHSVIVANLGEFAAREIGANPLIARVGGYYHDIGKVDQAEYFVENQRSFNKHDELKPSLSAAVIKSHVKIGIEKGKELKLPRVIIDIIGQHHGKTLIKYFYQRAKEGKGNGKITPEDYSYPGERPKSKEAAVIMLADHVEAASRTLKRPSVAKLERIVWDIIIEKFNSGELNESELTLRDLEIIKNSFVQILAGYFHTRIEYPKLNEANI